jgi:anti-sigma regulatory factor (Ser/Thr protein kinase)
LLAARQWRAVDAATAVLFRTPELGARLDAILQLLVPRYADWTAIGLDDLNGESRIAAIRHRDPSKNFALRMRIGEAFDESLPTEDPGSPRLLFPLLIDGQRFGDIGLGLEPGRRGFPSDDVATLRKIFERCAQALHNARLFERERRVALRFQSAALASALPRLGAYRFDAVYEAGSADALVGGDWYDAFLLADGRVVISIGDVVGSGLEAAIAMVNVRQTIRGVAQIHADPALMFEAADRTLRSQHPDRYVTAFVGVLDPVTQRCSYANAGHPAPYIRFHDGTLTQPHGHGMPLGLGFDQQIEVYQVAVQPGALMILYTDGLIESTKDIFGAEQRLERLLKQPDLLRFEHIAQRVHDVVLQGHGRDDVAILAVTVEDAPPVRRWRFDPLWSDAASRVRMELCDELRPVASDILLLDVELVFSELVANAIRHAPGTVEVILDRSEGQFVIHFLDTGPGFQFSPRLPADLYSEFGRGLFLITKLATDFTVERQPGDGSHARVVFTTATPGVPHP